MLKSSFNARNFSRFRDDRRGGLLVPFALLLPVLLLSAGLAVDYSRTYYLNGRLQKSADQAALAAVSALRNGVDQGAVQTLAAETFKANLGSVADAVGTPSITMAQLGEKVTATVNVQGTVDASLTKIGNFSSFTANSHASAEAQLKPAVNVTAGSLNGSGNLWGDPHFGLYGGVEYTIACDSKQWYNALSDGGIQWNARCADFTKTAWSIIYTAHKLYVGSHVIEYEALPDTPDTVNADTFPDDVAPSPNIPVGPAWPAKITIDGNVYDPSSDVSAGNYTKVLVSDGAAGISVTVQASRHATPAAFTGVPGGFYNFVSLTITTPTYTIVMAQPQGYSWDDITGTNAGMCGAVGGIWGKLLDGIPDTDPAHFILAGPNDKQSQFYWTPTCPNGVGGYAHLTE